MVLCFCRGKVIHLRTVDRGIALLPELTEEKDMDLADLWFAMIQGSVKKYRAK